MDRGTRLVLLAVFGAGVFLAGLELMITAVALPSILADLVQANGTSAWTELRKARWIINGYLLVYILMMPLAGRLADLWGARRLFMIAPRRLHVGSISPGWRRTWTSSSRARLVQAVGGGVLVPVGTAAAAHLYGAHGRPRALGVIGALTFLGMAAGPFLGAAILSAIHPDRCWRAPALPGARWRPCSSRPGGGSSTRTSRSPSVRSCLPGRPHPGGRHRGTPGRVDLIGAAVFGVALTRGLVGAHARGCGRRRRECLHSRAAHARAGRHRDRRDRRRDHPSPAGAGPVPRRPPVPSPGFSAATLVSLLTGYAFATAIIGGAVFVDRVLYGGPDEQRLALGALAGATAVGALASGFAVRVASYRLVTLVGLAASIVALFAMSRWSPATTTGEAAAALGLFGLGFGLSVTPRSTAAVEAAGQASFGAASSVVTVARMLGMAVGLAVLTAYGSTTIDRLSAQVYATPDAYLQYIPENLRDRPLKDPFVVEALESWASREAASIMVGLYLVAAVVLVVAIPPALALGGAARRGQAARMLPNDGAPDPGLIL